MMLMVKSSVTEAGSRWILEEKMQREDGRMTGILNGRIFPLTRVVNNLPLHIYLSLSAIYIST